MTLTNDNATASPKTPAGFLGKIADLMKAKNEQRAATRRSGNGMGRPQPKRPCGGCGSK